MQFGARWWVTILRNVLSLVEVWVLFLALFPWEKLKQANYILSKWHKSQMYVIAAGNNRYNSASNKNKATKMYARIQMQRRQAQTICEFNYNFGWPFSHLNHTFSTEIFSVTQVKLQSSPYIIVLHFTPATIVTCLECFFCFFFSGLVDYNLLYSLI